jgi:hypothetical protein
VLLAAYLAEFTAQDNVELYILTKPFMDGGNFKERMRDWANATFHGWVGEGAPWQGLHAAIDRRQQGQPLRTPGLHR